MKKSISSISNTFVDPLLISYSKVLAPAKKLSDIKVNGVTEISTSVLDRGFQVKINTSAIRMRYPKSIWDHFPKKHKSIVAQNITYCTTFQLPYMFPTIHRMNYKMPVPLSEAYFFKALSFALPATAIMQSQKEMRKTSNYFRKQLAIDYIFSNAKTDIPPYTRKSFGNQAVMPFTFGKDSLLTFAIARELGISIHPVYVSEPYLPYELVIKTTLADAFKKEFKIKLSFLHNSLGVIRDEVGWFGWELQLTQYTLMLLPYVYAKRAGYIFFSNEQSCNETVIDEDGFRCNPVFEQSHAWLLQNSLMVSQIGGNSLSIGSLLEPLHDLAIIKILHGRYPEIGKYQSSCDMPKKPTSDSRWCESCSKCSRIFIFLLANGIDPASVGFHHDLLKAKYTSLYPIFSTSKIKEFGYDQAEVGRDEQIYAFYLAYKRKVRGPVMKLFVRKFLAYAKKSEKKWKKIYYGLHSTKTIPLVLRSKVLKIYRQELDEET